MELAENEKFKQLHQLPTLDCSKYSPKALFYPKNSNSIIISTSTDIYGSRASAGIYKYNLINNHLELLQNYENDMFVRYHGQFIDYQNDILYLFGGNEDIYIEMNLKTKTIKDYGNSNNKYTGLYPIAVNISLTNDILFILSAFGSHAKFDCNHRTFLKVDWDTKIFAKSKSTISNSKLIFYASKQQLIIFGGQKCDNIF
eukprot:469019_1